MLVSNHFLTQKKVMKSIHHPFLYVYILRQQYTIYLDFNQMIPSSMSNDYFMEELCVFISFFRS